MPPILIWSYVTPAHSLKSTRASHSAQYCRYQTYSDALKNSFFLELFHSGMVFLLWWSIPRLLWSLGHSSFSQNTAERFFCFLCFCFVLFFLQIRTPWCNIRYSIGNIWSATRNCFRADTIPHLHK